MTTAVQVAEIGLKRLMVQGADAPLSADEYADFYTSMNHFMAELEANGTRLGYTAVSAAGDEVTVPDGAIYAIAHNVAVDVASDYGLAVSPSLAAAARRGYRTLRKLGSNPGKMSYPPTLPRGAGNFGESVGYTSPTYDHRATAQLTMVNNALATTAPLVGKVRGFWEPIRAENLSVDVTGRVTNTSDMEMTLTCKVTMTAFASGSINPGAFGFVKNNLSDGAFTYYDSMVLSTTRSSHTYQTSLRLQPGEFVELWVGDGLTGETITVTEAVMEVSS